MPMLLQSETGTCWLTPGDALTVIEGAQGLGQADLEEQIGQLFNEAVGQTDDSGLVDLLLSARARLHSIEVPTTHDPKLLEHIQVAYNHGSLLELQEDHAAAKHAREHLVVANPVYASGKVTKRPRHLHLVAN